MIRPALHYTVAATQRAHVVRPTDVRDSPEPAGIAHAVLSGETGTTVCGEPIVEFYLFFEVPFDTPGLTRCRACERGAI